MRISVALIAALLAVSLSAQATTTLRLGRTIPMPEVRGRIDHMAVDAKGQRLFVAALGNNTLEVVDLAAGKRLKRIPGLLKPQGVVYLSPSNQFGVASGDDGALSLFDGGSYALVKSLAALEDADNVRFDPSRQVIYVGYGSGALAVVDCATLKLADRIKLAGHPESFQLEQQGSRIFVNVPEARQIAVVDRDKKTVATVWPLKTEQGNFPMALDEANHRLFIGCRRPARLTVFDTNNGTELSHLGIDEDTDDLFYDAHRQRVYVSCGEGSLEVIDVLAEGVCRLRERIRTRAGARTSLFSGESDEFYLALPQRGRELAEIRVYRP